MVGTAWELSHSGGAFELNCTLDMTGVFDVADDTADSDSVQLSLLSTSLGIHNGGGVQNDNGGVGQSTGIKGITSQKPRSVVLGDVDLTSASEWTHISGSTGEALDVAARVWRHGAQRACAARAWRALR